MIESKYKGLRKVEYNELQDALQKKHSLSGKTNAEIAVKVGVNNTVSVNNAFNKEKQTVSDALLTRVMDAVEFEGVVVWDKGERIYFVKN